ncbi:hypothetical protein [Planococcus faecalis]|uniref:hypothetical protein n=1 Tax=Planococcus faecalis TaxID=1598147 RepID=UPI002109D8B7|nr:hypothetical protein [Planococcus faecalis]
MIYLGIDTSNSPLAIALIEDNTVLIEETANLKINHSLTAMPAIEEMMKKAKVLPTDLTHIAVAEVLVLYRRAHRSDHCENLGMVTENSAPSSF